MTYSQPDPAEETTANIEPEQPDTNPSEDAPTHRDTTDDTEGGGTQ